MKSHIQTTKFEGILPTIDSRMNAGTAGDYYEQFIEEASCPKCRGRRLSDTALAVTVGGQYPRAMLDAYQQALRFVEQLELTPTEAAIAREILKGNPRAAQLSYQCRSELPHAGQKGRDALWGEAQRIRLATQI